ncbi:MAG: hypothetical protein J0L74_13690 [Burkholderiales bacterium]|nr:hypothetical protein [Burkholderiales bacterium]
MNVGNLYMQMDPFTEHNNRCNAMYPGSHQCRREEVDRLMQYSTICGAVGSYAIVNDMGRYQSGYGWYYMCWSCGANRWDAICNGQPVPCCR